MRSPMLSVRSRLGRHARAGTMLAVALAVGCGGLLPASTALFGDAMTARAEGDVISPASVGWTGGGGPALQQDPSKPSRQDPSQPAPGRPLQTTQQSSMAPWLPDGVVDIRPTDGTRRVQAVGVRAATTPEVLEYLNVIRASNGLPTLAENASWSDGGVKHSRYVVLNGTLVHDEVDTNPFRTPEGDEAGNQGNVHASFDITGAFEERDAIDGWLTAPFHGMRMIDPKWATTGFGAYRRQPGDPITRFTAAATLDVLRGRPDVFAQPLTGPVMFPRPNGVSPFSRYAGNESPDPLDTPNCQARGFPKGGSSGAPIYLLLGGAAFGGPAVDMTATSLMRGGQPVEICAIVGDGFLVPAALGERNGIIFMPRQELTAGTYTMSVRAKVGTGAFATYTWSFKVAGPDLSVTSSHVGSFQAGAGGVYTLTVQNVAGAGPTMRDITVTDTLPSGMTFVSGTGTGWSCSASDPTVTCTRKGPLAPGASSTIALTVAVGVMLSQTLVNAVAVAVGGSSYVINESNMGNNAATDPTTIEGPPPPPTVVPTPPTTVPPDPCAPGNRSPVKVATTRDGSGRIRVTVSAGRGTLQQLQVGANGRTPVNALIDLTGGAVQGTDTVLVGAGTPDGVTVSSSSTISFVVPPTEYTFFVRRATAGAVMVPLVASDGCNEWPTFVGMGTGVS